MALTIRQLKATAAPFASDLAARGVAEAELAAIRPGGANNPARDVWAWLRYYGRLMALRALQEREGAAASPTSSEAAADTVILEALAGAAKPVTLSARDSQGVELAAYPKSAFALLQCHTRNLAIARLLEYADRLGKSDDPEAHELVERSLAEVVHQHRILAWIACTPGPGLPFPELTRDPELPAPFADLAPHDVLTICRAFDDANWARLRALEGLITPDPENEDTPRRRPSWSQFFGAMASSEGRASEQVLRDRALVGLLATTQLAASSQREAMAAAKEKARHRGEDET